MINIRTLTNEKEAIHRDLIKEVTTIFPSNLLKNVKKVEKELDELSGIQTNRRVSKHV